MGFDVLGFDLFHLAFDGEAFKTLGLVSLIEKTIASWDKLTGDDVLFKAVERIGLVLDGRIGEDTGGFLEGSGREEGFGLESGLGDAKDEWGGNGWALASEESLLVASGEALDVDLGAWEERCVSTIDDEHLAKHLSDDDLKVFVRDADALGGIDLLDFLDHVDLDLLG